MTGLTLSGEDVSKLTENDTSAAEKQKEKIGFSVGILLRCSEPSAVSERADRSPLPRLETRRKKTGVAYLKSAARLCVCGHICILRRKNRRDAEK